MTFRTGLLARVDRIRQLPQKALDLRQNQLSLVVRTWSGGSVGVGTRTDQYTQLFVGGSFNIRVRTVTQKDVVASGGLLTMQDVKVGPFTPDYPGGGLPKSVYDPPATGSPQEILFVITGHGMGPSGTVFERYSDMSLANFTSWLFLKSPGVHL